MLVFHLSIRFFFLLKRCFNNLCIYCPPGFNVLFWIIQVERGKQAYYCYDDVELKKVQRSFPSNASYNIQRFKGEAGIVISFCLLYLETAYFTQDIQFGTNFLLENCVPILYQLNEGQLTKPI